METLVMIGQFILGLSILITLHEFGHYIAARAFGIKVEKFYLFFDAWGKKLISFKKGETEYGIGWLPLGGYVKIAGMIDESMDKDQMKKDPEPWEFRSKPAWQRLIVMVAGVILNFILGILIFTFITFGYGETYIPVENMEHGIQVKDLGRELGLQDGDKLVYVNGNEIDRFRDILSSEVLLGSNASITIKRNGQLKEIKIPDDFANKLSEKGIESFVTPRIQYTIQQTMPKTPAEEAGLQPGDVIASINDTSTIYFDQLTSVLSENAGKEVKMTILRDGEKIEKTVTVGEDGKLGFIPKSDLETAKMDYGFGQSISRGTERAFEAVSQTVLGLGKMIQGDVDPSKGLQGPISIAKNIYGGVWIWSRFWEITGLLSMIIGFMNILPIPALDGGHVIFLLIEMVRGKPLSDKVLGVIQTIGMIILLTLMVFVIFNDIWRNFF